MSNPTWTVTIDPAAAIENRTELNLNSGPIQVSQEGIDWGESQIKPYLAEQEWGETPVSFRVPNRIVSIPLFLGANHTGEEEYEARMKLQQKVGQLQREGGVLYRQRGSTQAGSAPMYCDIVNATLKMPDVWGETGKVEPSVILQLECLPDFFGETTELETVTGGGWGVEPVLQHAAVQAVIAGDYPARAYIKLENKNTEHNWRGLIWGVRCKNYSNASTAALKIGGNTMTVINGATTESEAGTYTGHVVKLASPALNTWHPFLKTDISGTGPLTHKGTYQVWARVWATESTTTRVRFAWSLDDATVPTYNEAQTIPFPSHWCLVNLGQITIEKAPVGENWWRGVIQAETGGVAHAVYVDNVEFQPLDEYAGILSAADVVPSTYLNTEKTPGHSENSPEYQGGAAWGLPGYIGEGKLGTNVSLSGGGSTHYSESLFCKTFGFVLGTSATIRGLELNVRLGPSTEEYPAPKAHLTATMSKAGTPAAVGYEQPFESESPVTLTFGGPNILFGDSWTKANIEESTFGAYFFLVSSGWQIKVELLSVDITVYYTTSESEVPGDAVVYSTRKAQIRGSGSYREDTGTESYVKVSEERGSLLRLPASGIEGKPVQLFIRPTLGKPGVENDEIVVGTMAAQVVYAPTWVGRP